MNDESDFTEYFLKQLLKVVLFPVKIGIVFIGLLLTPIVATLLYILSLDTGNKMKWDEHAFVFIKDCWKMI